MNYKVPYETYLLAGLLLFLSLCGLYGGLCFIIDSSGRLLNLNSANYFNRANDDFLIPGFVLLIVFGIIPLLLIFPLLRKPHVKWANFLNIYARRYWAWTYTLFLGIFLVIWIDVQIWLMGYYSFYQILWSLYGLIIIFVCLLPAQVRFFSEWKISSMKSYEAKDRY